MKIVLEKSKYHKFALYFDYNQAMVDFCRNLKDGFGWDKFSFEQLGMLKRWVFSDPLFIEVLRTEFPAIVIGEGVWDEVIQIEGDAKLIRMQKEKLDEIKEKTDTNFKVKGIKGEMYAYQKVGVEFLVEAGGRAIVADEMGCIAGDEKVIVNRGGNGRSFSMREVFEREGKTWSKKIPSMTRSLTADGIFKLNKINNVLYKGIKNTLIINAKTVDGKKYSLRLTHDHRIATPSGWVRADKLSIGSEITVNGKHMRWCEMCQKQTEHAMSEHTRKYKPANYGKCKKCIYRFVRRNKITENKTLLSGESLDKNGYVYVSGMYFHPTVKNSAKKFRSIFKHILVYEAYKNDVSYEEWKEMCSKNKIPDGSFFVDSVKYAVHHKDSDKRNNTIGNLELLSHSDHATLSGEKNIRNLAEFILPNTAKVASITEGGKTDVYDIKMDGENKNFIVNGVVVHNCGKTVQAIAYAKHMGFKRILIVCPASVKFAWGNEVKKWTNLSSIVIDSKTDLSKIDGSVNAWIINYDILKKHYGQLSKIKFNGIIGDESQLLKSPRAFRTKAFRALSMEIPSVLLLTGTPLLSRPSELFSLLNIIDPASWQNWYDYAKRFCDMHQTRWGMDTSGVSNAEELHSLIKRYFIRRDKTQVLKELPPKTHITLPVDLDPETAKEYKTAATDLANYLRTYAGKGKKEIAKSMAAEKLTQLNVLRRLSESGKIKVATELIQSIIDSGEKVLVFSSFVKPLEMLKEKFEKESVIITGKTTVGERGEIVNQFQNNDDIKVFFGGIKSAGVGITLTKAANVVFLGYSWCPADHQQAEDRAHRIGTKASSINIHQLHSIGTIDEDLKEMLDTKQEIFETIIEGKEDNSSSKAMEAAINRVLAEY